MKTLILTLFFALLLSSCDQERDAKKLRQVFSETKYDDDIIKSLPFYDSLKNIIISNIDTIFKFRNSRHFVFILMLTVTPQLFKKTKTFTAFIITMEKQRHLVMAQDQMTKS